MLRSILVALDGTDTSEEAGRLALDIAHRLRSHVQALGIVNSAWIERPEPVPIGGTAYKGEADARRMESAGTRIAAVLEAFRQQGEKAGVASLQVRETHGDPKEVLQSEATAHDLIMLGRNSLFDMDADLYEFPFYVDQIIRHEPRPVLLVPRNAAGEAEKRSLGPVLVAFDGSVAASRTLHMFALLGLARDLPIHVLTLDERSEEDANATAEQACELLRRHGAEKVHPLGLGGKQAGTAAETILGTAKALNAGMIAMGAYGHSGIRELFGSCTRAILHACPVPLFLHH